MILPHLQKFEYDIDYHTNIRKLVSLIVNNNVLLCPQKNALYGWWLPKTSPNHEEGGWAKLKHISSYEQQNVSLWSRPIGNSMKEIVESKMEVYLINMSEVGYTSWSADGQNFDILIKHDDIMYSTNLTNEHSDVLMVTSAKSIMDPIYSLETNSVMYSMNDWTHLDNLAEWSVSDDTFITQEEPMTPKPSCKKNLMDEYGSNSENEEESEEESEADYGEGWKNSETESGGPNLIYEDSEEEDEDEDELIPFYNPWSWLTNEQVEAAYALGYREESWDDSQEPIDWSEFSDKAKEHLGTLGMDEVLWKEYLEEDNKKIIAEGIMVDKEEDEDEEEDDSDYEPSILDLNEESEDEPEDYEETCEVYRMDYSDGGWYTKEEFKEYYGSNYVWKMMNPKKYIMREVLYYAYFTAARLPLVLQDDFIKEYLKTYE